MVSGVHLSRLLLQAGQTERDGHCCFGWDGSSVGSPARFLLAILWMVQSQRMLWSGDVGRKPKLVTWVEK